MQRPTLVKQVRCFLGMITYLRKYIKDCGQLTPPINDLAKGNGKQKIIWTPECNKKIQTLKRRLIKAPILQYLNNKGCYKLDSDASNTAIGAVLRICQPGQEDYLPVCYESRKLTDTKTRYLIHNKELLAIYHACRKWRCYLEGHPNVRVLTDHKSLIYFKTQNALACQQAKWMGLIEQLNLDIQ